MVRAVKRSTPVGCLSNTNALHWDLHSARWSLLESLDFRFLSFDPGMVKPDRALFERVAQILPASSARVLFLDDNALNVEVAEAVGFVAVQVRGVTGARQALTDFGVLSS
jgi:FMN phosphatase YigB (HAD superfamily)